MGLILVDGRRWLQWLQRKLFTTLTTHTYLTLSDDSSSVTQGFYQRVLPLYLLGLAAGAERHLLSGPDCRDTLKIWHNENCVLYPLLS